MAGLAGREERVVEVQVAHHRSVVERGAVGRARARGEQSAQGHAAQLADLLADDLGDLGAERAEGAAERVQDAQLELPARRFRDVLEPCPANELGQPIHLGAARGPVAMPLATSGRVLRARAQRGHHRRTFPAGAACHARRSRSRIARRTAATRRARTAGSTLAARTKPELVGVG
jgi:hypothetical protein